MGNIFLIRIGIVARAVPEKRDTQEIAKNPTLDPSATDAKDESRMARLVGRYFNRTRLQPSFLMLTQKDGLKGYKTLASGASPLDLD